MVIATELPFSTSGGMLSLILPGLASASPVIWRIAAAIEAGVALAGRTMSIAPAPARKARRVEPALKNRSSISLVLERRQKRHHVLDLLRGQHRLAAEIRRHAGQAVDPVKGRHDGSRIEAGGVNHPQPQFALRPARSGASETWRQIALEALVWKWARMAQQTSALAPDHDGPAVHRIAGLAGQRFRDGVAHDRIGHEHLLCGARRAAEREHHPCKRHPGKRDAADHPKVSPVMVRNQVS